MVLIPKLKILSWVEKWKFRLSVIRRSVHQGADQVPNEKSIVNNTHKKKKVT